MLFWAESSSLPVCLISRTAWSRRVQLNGVGRDRQIRIVPHDPGEFFEPGDYDGSDVPRPTADFGEPLGFSPFGLAFEEEVLGVDEAHADVANGPVRF